MQHLVEVMRIQRAATIGHRLSRLAVAVDVAFMPGCSCALPAGHLGDFWLFDELVNITAKLLFEGTGTSLVAPASRDLQPTPEVGESHFRDSPHSRSADPYVPLDRWPSWRLRERWANTWSIREVRIWNYRVWTQSDS